MHRDVLTVLVVEPRPHVNTVAMLEDAIAMSARWGVKRILLYYKTGNGLTDWVRGALETATELARQELAGGDPPAVELHLLPEWPSRHMTPWEYSYVLFDWPLWRSISAASHPSTEGGPTHMLVTQTDAVLSRDRGAWSLWSFAERYHAVGCPVPGKLKQWIEGNSPPDRVTSNNGGLIMKRIGPAATVALRTAPEDMKYWEDQVYYRASASFDEPIYPTDEEGRRFCTFLWANPFGKAPLGYHSIKKFHSLQTIRRFAKEDWRVWRLWLDVAELHCSGIRAEDCESLSGTIKSLGLKVRRCGLGKDKQDANCGNNDEGAYTGFRVKLDGGVVSLSAKGGSGMTWRSCAVSTDWLLGKPAPGAGVDPQSSACTVAEAATPLSAAADQRASLVLGSLIAQA